MSSAKNSAAKELVLGDDLNAPDHFVRSEIDRMLRNSQTKVIMPVVALGLLQAYQATHNSVFSDSEIRKIYERAVHLMISFLGHDLHIGARYYDAYGSRMSRYKVLRSTGHLTYELLPPYTECAEFLCKWIPERIRQHIDHRLGAIPTLGTPETRLDIAKDSAKFLKILHEQIDQTPVNFEIFSFAVIKTHLEKFACKIYRDTRTSAHDNGVDLSTNFGVVYQIKKLKISNQSEADQVCAELQLNFDRQRLQDGNVILIIDDIAKDVRQYLVNMKIQSISKQDILKLAANFDDLEDRQKALRVVYEEFRREYSSNIT